jgi:hypothetical protein
MRVSSIIARVNAEMPVFKGRVYAAATLDAVVEEGFKATPSGWIFLPNTSAGDNLLANAVSQKMTQRFGVVIIVKDVADARGEAANRTMEDIRADLWTALGGWTPNSAEDPLESDGDHMILCKPKEGLLIWNEKFRTSFLKRANT